ncbi:unnamed protein product [Knipowitschia caucasica]
MSLPPQLSKPAKHRAMKETDVFYGMGPPTLEPNHGDLNTGASGLYHTEKAAPNMSHHYHQQTQLKWMQPEQAPIQGPLWNQDLGGWSQGPQYPRGQVFHEGLSMAENQMQDVYTDNSQWDSMIQMQSYQQQQHQQQVHSIQAPMLQSFQTFRQSKPQQAQFNPGYYAGFAQSKSVGYEQAKPQGILQQIQQQKQMVNPQQQLQMQHLQQMQQYQQQCMQERHLQQRSQHGAQQLEPNVELKHQQQPEAIFQPQRETQETEESAEQIHMSSSTEIEKVPERTVDPTVVPPGGNCVAQPRRSRRLSREGQSPSNEALLNGTGQDTAEGLSTGGVIQSTRRKRRASKEINLETLAQQAAQRESLPAKVKADVPSSRTSSMAPLVMPVSVPVPRPPLERWMGHKASVIVARRRSLRNSVTDSTQDAELDSGSDEDGGKSRTRRRPRPEPLIIPPPRPSSFIPASVYSSITPYQSHLRSPVRITEPPLLLPPYTPPPILSPVRGGSGLYFSTFLSSMAAGTQAAPPQATPRSSSVSLLRLSSTASSEGSPPLPLVTDATPVSLEPRINIGQQYQAYIPEVHSPGTPPSEQHQADLLWRPLEEPTTGGQGSVQDLVNMACSSVLYGGGTNQELVLHCLFQSGGDILETVRCLLLKDVLFPKGHPLCDYHYSGSDCWTPEEKRYFNKGISAYRKDFHMVQKLVQTKSVAQCVEFYYTYKKQVKVGRSGAVAFGPLDSPLDEVLENKSSAQSLAHHRVMLKEEETKFQPEHLSDPCEQNQESRHQVASVMVPEMTSCTPPQTSPASSRTRSEPQAKKAKPPPKAPADPDQVFPCKKCGRVFGKVKSRSAHMKSHAEQEKKAAALRLRQQEEAQGQTPLQPEAPHEPGARLGARRPEPPAQARTARPYQEASGGESSEADDAYDEDWH